MAAPVVHFEINTANPTRVQQFFSDLFGWKTKVIPEMNYGLVNTGSKKGIQGGIGPKQQEAPSVIFYAEVDDPQKYLDKAVSLGGKILVPVETIPNMVTFALFADPDGNTIGLVKSEERSKPKKRVAKKKPARPKRTKK